MCKICGAWEDDQELRVTTRAGRGAVTQGGIGRSRFNQQEGQLKKFINGRLEKGEKLWRHNEGGASFCVWRPRRRKRGSGGGEGSPSEPLPKR